MVGAFTLVAVRYSIRSTKTWRSSRSLSLVKNILRLLAKSKFHFKDELGSNLINFGVRIFYCKNMKLVSGSQFSICVMP